METNFRRITKEQKTFLVKYLEEHREFANCRFTNDAGAKRLDKLWSKLAVSLNCIGGAIKDGDGWKRAWVNMRSKTKQKAQDLQNALGRRGVNGSLRKGLSELDKRIIGVMTKKAIIGQVAVGEPLKAANIVPESIISLEHVDIQKAANIVPESIISLEHVNIQTNEPNPEMFEAEADSSDSKIQMQVCHEPGSGTSRQTPLKNQSRENDINIKFLQLEEQRLAIEKGKLREKRRKNLLLAKRNTIEKEKSFIMQQLSKSLKKLLNKK